MTRVRGRPGSTKHVFKSHPRPQTSSDEMGMHLYSIQPIMDSKF
jgi:hypothetical protein